MSNISSYSNSRHSYTLFSDPLVNSVHPMKYFYHNKEACIISYHEAFKFTVGTTYVTTNGRAST